MDSNWRLRVPAVREFMHSIQEAIVSTEAVPQLLPEVYGRWKAAFDEMNRVYEISLKSEDSELIRNLDVRRDNLMTAVKASANSFRKALDDDTRRRGTAVWDAIGSFRVDIEAQYNIQTAQLDSLLGVLLGEQLRPSVEALGLLPLVTELKSLNDRLHELVGIRDLENASKPDGQRQEAMTAVIAAYRTLVKYVNAWYLLNVELAGAQNAQLALLIDLVNSIIARYRRNFPGVGGSGRPGSSEDSEGTEDSEGGEGTGDDNGENSEGSEDTENSEGSEGSENPGTGGSGTGGSGTGGSGGEMDL